ncbi:MAG: cellulose binding domain-containing protein [Xenococcaceae cyanobacterium MO_188.B29]|nr:cellulose binding domain-containing protein [Xenococcaceae cyanobacterium MO_188.B29]
MSSLASQFNKIVFQFDGNNNDPDDIAAVPVAAMLINSAGLQDKTTFFYDNNLAEKNEDFQVDKMRNSAEYAEKLGIDTVDYQSNIGATTDKLVDIFNSGEKVLSIEGGPMEAVYRALEQTDPENRQNITLLSHSWWNENHDVITRDGVDEARTWSDLKEDFPEVTFLEIEDQNDGFYNDGWNYLDNQSDPVYQEGRDLMIDSNKRNDPSDAGMLFYALTGNEHGDPYDAKNFLEDNPPQFENQSPPNPEPPKEPTETNNDYDIELDVDLSSSGNSQLTGELSFTNNGDSFEGWTIEFEAAYEIDKIWNAEIISHSGDRYVIGDVESNDYVYDGETTDWGFTASVDDNDWVEPTNYSFNGEKLETGGK